MNKCNDCGERTTELYNGFCSVCLESFKNKVDGIKPVSSLEGALGLLKGDEE